VTSRRRVLLVGAYERDNFGDLLFLLVTERYLEGADVTAAAPFAADMRALLDREVPAYGPLLRDEAFDAIWTVGGQVGRVDLVRAYKMSASRDEWRRFALAPPGARLGILREATGGAPPLSPYIPLPFAYPRNAGAVTILNSVGIAGVRGVESPRREAIVAALRGANSLTVRDRNSSALLEELGVEHRLAPDAVHALGVLRPGRPEADGPAVVQLSSARLRLLGHERVGEALARSPQLAGRPVRLLLAGTATGHDAVSDYEAVVRAAKGADVAILAERRPLELADHIRRARVVIGTSLHARVVAAAYGVPRVSLAKPKPTRYAKEWDPAMPYDVALDDLDAAIEAAISRAGRREAVAHAERLAVAAHDHLSELARLATTAPPADAGARVAARHRDQLEALATLHDAQQAEATRLRIALDRHRAARPWGLARRFGRPKPQNRILD
jgi:Polysaccharide pyruvyl transferase